MSKPIPPLKTIRQWNLRMLMIIAFMYPITFSQVHAAPLGYLPPASIAQATFAIPVKGSVKSSTKEALPGVNVVIKGTTTGTVTDADGNYSLTVSDESSVLIFSFVGYITEEVAVAGRSVVDVVLLPDVKALSEVVVVGYGQQKKATLTGAVSQVGEEVFKDRPVSNAALALQGEVPGLTITRNSSRPGNEGLLIRIRGNSSTSAVDPLIVIDGIPLIDMWEFNQLNPNDIESVSVLKDASAAIYGARAAGGVILVTTKRGKGEKMKLNYNGSIRINTIGITTPFADMQQWATQYLQAATQDKVDANGLAVEWFPQWGRETIEKMTLGEPFLFTNPQGKVYQYANNNYFDELYGQSISQQHSISLRGSTSKTAYMASVGYADNQSVLKTAYDGEKKYNLRLNYDYRFTERIKIETGLSFDERQVSTPKNGIGQGFFDAPVFPTYNSKGQYYDDYSGQRNPVAATKEGGRIENKESFVRLNSKLTAEIINGLSLSLTGSLVNRNGWKTAYNQNYQNWDWLGTQVTGNLYANPELAENVYNTVYQTYGGFLTYTKTIAKNHHLTALAGYTGELNNYKEIEAKRAKLQFPGIIALNASDNSTGLSSNAGRLNHWGLLSWIGRVNYAYKEKYLMELLGRRDGSSRFDPAHRWSNFGGVSAGWVISQEGFMQELKLVDNLKLRASYGETGGQSGLGLYEYVSSINLGANLFGDTRALQQTAYVSGITSLDRTWERMVNSNVGLDFGLLNSRLSGSVDLFEKKNVGMLNKVKTPQLLGGDAPSTNNGTLSVKGWELALNWRNTIHEFSYSIGFQLSDNKSKITSLKDTDVPGQGKIAAREGYSLNSLFVYETAGYFTSQEEINAYYTAYGNKGNLTSLPQNGLTNRLRPGDLKVVDRNGDGTIDTKDTYYYGNAMPRLSYGLNLGFRWKGFDFATFLQGVGQQYLLREGNTRAPFFRNYLNINTSYSGKTWTPENPAADYPRVSFDSNKNNWNWVANDVNVQKLRYLRMKSLTLGYSLPKTLSAKAKMESIRVYFSGGDLFEFSSINDGFDPEFQESADSNYPFLRTYSFGLDITL